MMRMGKFNATDSYSRMAEFIADSGVTDPRQVTSKIAQACGVSFQAAIKWKDGLTKSVTMPPISRFCDKYGANPDYISTGTLPKKRGEALSPEFEEVLRRFPLASAERQKIIVDLLRIDSGEEI